MGILNCASRFGLPLITDRKNKLRFLDSFSHSPLKLELLNFFLDNFNTPKDRTKEYNTKPICHAKIIQYIFNTRPISFVKEDIPISEVSFLVQ